MILGVVGVVQTAVGGGGGVLTAEREEGKRAGLGHEYSPRAR